HADVGRALGELFGSLGGGIACRAYAGEIALHVGAEDRNACGRELFGHDLQGHGLARSGGAGDKAVPVRPRQKEVLGRPVVGPAAADENRVGHVRFLMVVRGPAVYFRPASAPRPREAPKSWPNIPAACMTARCFPRRAPFSDTRSRPASHAASGKAMRAPSR